MSQKVYHEHFSVVYTMKLSRNTYFMKCSEKNISQFILALTTGIIKKLLSITRNKKKKHDKILMLAKSKLSSIETLASQALIDLEISHEEFVTILKERDKYEKMKKILKMSVKI